MSHNRRSAFHEFSEPSALERARETASRLWLEYAEARGFGHHRNSANAAHAFHSDLEPNASGRIAAAAQRSFGQQLWREHAADVQWGALGCAASVSHVLRTAGAANVDELSVRGLSAKLRQQGWEPHPFAQRRPGDVIIALGNRHGHTGVVGQQRDVTFNNHSSNGRWSLDRSNYWLSSRWPTVYVLRAPLNS